MPVLVEDRLEEGEEREEGEGEGAENETRRTRGGWNVRKADEDARRLDAGGLPCARDA